MKASSSGGGVAGPAAAMALQRVGMDTVVLERRAVATPTEGSYFTIAPNGLDALGLLDALQIAREAGFPSRTNTMYGAAGRMLGELGSGSRCPTGWLALTTKRSLLASRLLDEAGRRGVAVRRGSRSPRWRATATAPPYLPTVRGSRLTSSSGPTASARRVRAAHRPRCPRRPATSGSPTSAGSPGGTALADHPPPGGVALRLRRPRLLRCPPDSGWRRRVVRQRARTGDHPRAARRHEPREWQHQLVDLLQADDRAGRRARRDRNPRAGR